MKNYSDSGSGLDPEYDYAEYNYAEYDESIASLGSLSRKHSSEQLPLPSGQQKIAEFELTPELVGTFWRSFAEEYLLWSRQNLASDVEDSDVEDSDVEDSDVEDSDVEDSDVEDSDVEDSDVEDSDVEDSDIEDSDVEDNQSSDFSQLASAIDQFLNSLDGAKSTPQKNISQINRCQTKNSGVDIGKLNEPASKLIGLTKENLDSKLAEQQEAVEQIDEKKKFLRLFSSLCKKISSPGGSSLGLTRDELQILVKGALKNLGILGKLDSTSSVKSLLSELDLFALVKHALNDIEFLHMQFDLELNIEKQIEVKDEKIKKKQEKINHKKAEIKKKQSDIKVQEGLVSAQQKQIEEYEGKIKTIEGEIRKTNNAFITKQKEILSKNRLDKKNLGSSPSSLQNKKRKDFLSQSPIFQEYSQQKSLEVEWKQSQIRELEEEREKIASENKEIESKKKQLEDEKEQLKAEMEKLGNEKTQLEQDKAPLENEKTRITKQKASLQPGGGQSGSLERTLCESRSAAKNEQDKLDAIGEACQKIEKKAKSIFKLETAQLKKDKEALEDSQATQGELQNLQATQKELEERQKNQEEELKKLPGTQEKELEKFRRAQEKELKKFQETQKKELEIFLSCQGKRINELQKKQKKDFQKAQNSQKETLKKFRESQKKEFNQFKQNSNLQEEKKKIALGKREKSQNESLKKLQESQKTALENLKKTQEENIKKLPGSQFKETQEKAQRGFQAAQKSALEEFQKNQEKALKILQETQEKTLEDLKENQKEIKEKSKKLLDDIVAIKLESNFVKKIVFEHDGGQYQFDCNGKKLTELPRLEKKVENQLLEEKQPVEPEPEPEPEPKPNKPGKSALNKDDKVKLDQEIWESLLGDKGFSEDFLNRNCHQYSSGITVQHGKSNYSSDVISNRVHQLKTDELFTSCLKYAIAREKGGDYHLTGLLRIDKGKAEGKYKSTGCFGWAYKNFGAVHKDDKIAAAKKIACGEVRLPKPGHVGPAKEPVNMPHAATTGELSAMIKKTYRCS